MKVIDLLNKIANGEEVPKKIIAGSEECEYFYDNELKDYRNVKTNEKLFEDEIKQYIKYYLNDEIEILEEEKKTPTLNNIRESYGLPRIEEKKIPEKLKAISNKGDYKIIYPTNEILTNKINEIICYLDYLKSKGE